MKDRLCDRLSTQDTEIIVIFHDVFMNNTKARDFFKLCSNNNEIITML